VTGDALSLTAGNLGTVPSMDGGVQTLTDNLYVPALWQPYDTCDGVTASGLYYRVTHEVSDAQQQGRVVHRSWFHRLTVTCDDRGCCPDAVTFEGVDAWNRACIQLQDIIDFLNWK